MASDDPWDWRPGDPIPEPSETQQVAKSEEELEAETNWLAMGLCTLTHGDGRVSHGHLFIKKRESADGE